MDKCDPALMPSGFPPAWLKRTGNSSGAKFKLIEDRAAVIREIFSLCLNGFSAIQIADILNKRGLRTFAYGKRGGKAEWRPQRVSLLLRSEAVLGYHKAQSIGRVAIYPPVIDDATWTQARKILAQRAIGLRGREGRSIPNLFTGHAFCGQCGRTLRCETATGKGWKRLICSGNRDSATCDNPTRFDLRAFEPVILEHLSKLIIAKEATSVNEPALLLELMGPAQRGDINARRRLRALLNRLEYRLESFGHQLKLFVGDREYIINGPQLALAKSTHTC